MMVTVESVERKKLIVANVGMGTKEVVRTTVEMIVNKGQRANIRGTLRLVLDNEPPCFDVGDELRLTLEKM